MSQDSQDHRSHRIHRIHRSLPKLWKRSGGLATGRSSIFCSLRPIRSCSPLTCLKSAFVHALKYYSFRPNTYIWDTVAIFLVQFFQIFLNISKNIMLPLQRIELNCLMLQSVATQFNCPFRIMLPLIKFKKGHLWFVSSVSFLLVSKTWSGQLVALVAR